MFSYNEMMRVSAELQRRITISALRPGDALESDELATSLNATPETVEAALHDLMAAGLVVKDGHGMRVRSWSRHDAEDVFLIRIVLEGLAARLCALRADDQRQAKIEAANRRFKETLVAGDERGNIDADVALHTEILAGAGSPELERLYRAFRAYGCTMSALGTSADKPLERVMGLHVLNCHDDLVEAIGAGDPDAAADAGRRHADVARQRSFGTME